jgi:hypothetical protein
VALPDLNWGPCCLQTQVELPWVSMVSSGSYYWRTLIRFRILLLLPHYVPGQRGRTSGPGEPLWRGQVRLESPSASCRHRACFAEQPQAPWRKPWQTCLYQATLPLESLLGEIRREPVYLWVRGCPEREDIRSLGAPNPFPAASSPSSSSSSLGLLLQHLGAGRHCPPPPGGPPSPPGLWAPGSHSGKHQYRLGGRQATASGERAAGASTVNPRLPLILLAPSPAAKAQLRLGSRRLPSSRLT